MTACWAKPGLARKGCHFPFHVWDLGRSGRLKEARAPERGSEVVVALVIGKPSFALHECCLKLDSATGGEETAVEIQRPCQDMTSALLAGRQGTQQTKQHVVAFTRAARRGIHAWIS